MGLYEFRPDDARRFAGEQRLDCRTRGDELQVKSCPYCRGGSHGDYWTFAINLRTGQFKCMRNGCGAHGNMITLAKDFNFSLGTAVDEYYNSRKQFKNIHRKERPETRPKAVEYMESRGIPEEITKRYGITTRKDFENIIVFPFYDENNILQFVKYRNTTYTKGDPGSKEFSEKDTKPILFGMDQCNPENKTLVLTEGQIDSLSCTAAGIGNAVSVPTGAKGFTWVPYCWDFMEKYDTLIVFGDHENGKITLLDEMTVRFHGSVKHVRPEDYKDCKDANDLLRKYGKEAVRDAVLNAVIVENPKIKRLADVQRVNLSQMECLESGIEALNKVIGGFYFGQLVILTGERGFGKSTLASQFATYAVRNHYPVFFYSGELLDWYFQAWFERQVAGNGYINKIVSRSNFTAYSIDAQYAAQIEAWYREYMYIYDNGIMSEDPENETGTLLETMETAIKQYGCRMIVIDNLMTAMSDDIKSDQYRQQSNFVKRLAWMAKRFDVLVFLIVHPRKVASTGKDNDFTNDDIAGSSNITNLADIVLRYTKPKKNEDEPDDVRYLQITKNRLNGKTNFDGIKLYFEESSKRISATTDFDWRMGWENMENSNETKPEQGSLTAFQSVSRPDDGFMDVSADDSDLPFGFA